MVVFTNHKMVFLTNQIGQKIGQPKNLIKKIVQNNKYLPTHPPWPPTYLSTTHIRTIHLHTCTKYIYEYNIPHNICW